MGEKYGFFCGLRLLIVHTSSVEYAPVFITNAEIG